MCTFLHISIILFPGDRDDLHFCHILRQESLDLLLPSHQMPKMMGMKRTSMPRGRERCWILKTSRFAPNWSRRPSWSRLRSCHVIVIRSMAQLLDGVSLFIACSNAATVTGKTGRHTPSLPKRAAEQRIYIGLKYIHALQSVAGRHPAGRSARRRRRRNRRHSTHGLRCRHRRQTVQRLARGWGRRHKCRGGPRPSSTWHRRQW